MFLELCFETCCDMCLGMCLDLCCEMCWGLCLSDLDMVVGNCDSSRSIRIRLEPLAARAQNNIAIARNRYSNNDTVIDHFGSKQYSLMLYPASRTCELSQV